MLKSVLVLLLLAAVSAGLGIAIAKQLPKSNIEPVKVRIVGPGGEKWSPPVLSESDKSRVMRILENSSVYRELVEKGYRIVNMQPIAKAKVKLKLQDKTPTLVMEDRWITGAVVVMRNNNGDTTVITVSLEDNKIVRVSSSTITISYKQQPQP